MISPDECQRWPAPSMTAQPQWTPKATIIMGPRGLVSIYFESAEELDTLPDAMIFYDDPEHGEEVRAMALELGERMGLRYQREHADAMIKALEACVLEDMEAAFSAPAEALQSYKEDLEDWQPRETSAPVLVIALIRQTQRQIGGANHGKDHGR